MYLPILKVAAVSMLLIAAACENQRMGVTAPTAIAAVPKAKPVAHQPDSKPAKITKAAVVPQITGLKAPDWQIGDHWRYSDGYGLTVEDRSGGATLFRRLDDPTQWTMRRGFLREEAQSATAYRKTVFRSISADAGMVLQLDQPLVFTREYMSNATTRIHTTSWVVEGRETITVPAGDFETYVVVMRTRNSVTGWTGFERWWYAPEVRNYVRMEYRYGDQGLGSRVLTEFRPGKVRLSGKQASEQTGPSTPNLLMQPQ